MEKKISVLYIYVWLFLNGTVILIFSHITIIIILFYILFKLSKHFKRTKNLLNAIKINQFLIDFNTLIKHSFGINNYLSVILFLFALSEIVLEVYYHNQILLRATATYEMLLFLLLVIFSVVNIYFGGWVQYKMSKLDEID